VRRVGIAGVIGRAKPGWHAGVRAKRRMSCSPSSNPPQIDDGAGGGTVAGSFQAFQEIRYALFEMGERRTALSLPTGMPVEAFRQRAQRAFKIVRMVVGGCRRPGFPASRSGRQQCAARERHRSHCCRQSGKAGESWSTLADSVCTVVGKPRQRVVGGDVGDDRAQARRSRFRAAARSTDRRSSAGSNRVWRRGLRIASS